MRYFDYLSARQLIGGKVEEVELDELPGATGLRALRVEVSGNEKEKLGSDDLIRDIELALQLQ
jgi:hypothetical protein